MFDPSHLAALSAVLRCGSFERAGQELGLTQSAVSQRMRALEEQVGAPLVIRAQPSRATEAGQRLFRHAEELRLLEQDVRRDLGLAEHAASGASGWPTLRLAVNADSLATWFVSAMAGIPDMLFDLVVDDQDHSADWLKRGEVRAAITGSPEPVQGCDCRPLGTLRYLVTASSGYRARWFGCGVTAATLAAAPVLTFNVKDRLQGRWAEIAVGEAVSGPSHWIPSSTAFVEAAIAGLGWWGMNPEALVRPALAEGRLEALVENSPLDVPLYWHVNRSMERLLQPVTRQVTAAARQVLRPLA